VGSARDQRQAVELLPPITREDDIVQNQLETLVVRQLQSRCPYTEVERFEVGGEIEGPCQSLPCKMSGLTLIAGYLALESGAAEAGAAAAVEMDLGALGIRGMLARMSVTFCFSSSGITSSATAAFIVEKPGKGPCL